MNDVLDSENLRCIKIITDALPLQISPEENDLKSAELSVFDRISERKFSPYTV